jgi:pyrroloquinoline quinone biosynthesis protein D
MSNCGDERGKPASERVIIGSRSRPALARHVRLRFDEARKAWVLLAPERLLTASETAVAVLELCDGERSVREIASLLAAEFEAPEAAILDDILPMLQDLADRRFLAPDRTPAG